MNFTIFGIIASYELYADGECNDVVTDHHQVIVQESEKSFFNPQEGCVVSADAKKALKAFSKYIASKHSGYEFDDIQIEWIDGLGNDTNI